MKFNLLVLALLGESATLKVNDSERAENATKHADVNATINGTALAALGANASAKSNDTTWTTTSSSTSTSWSSSSSSSSSWSSSS